MSFTAQYSDGDATIKLFINEEFGIYYTVFKTDSEGVEKTSYYENKNDAIIAFSRLVGGELACLAPELEPQLIP